MEKILEILNEINDEVNFETETALVDDHLLSSFEILSLVSELEDAYDIEIEPDDMIPENFNSAEAILEMVERLQG